MFGEKLLVLLKKYAGTNKLAPVAAGVGIMYNIECGSGTTGDQASAWRRNCGNCDCDCDDDYDYDNDSDCNCD